MSVRLAALRQPANSLIAICGRKGYDKMKILITGGTGVIGVALTSALAKDAGNKIYVSSRKKRDSNFNNVAFVVDLMNYTQDEVKTCVDILSKKTKKYYFISSCRVFGDCDPIEEGSPMLLDVTEDIVYKKTNDYALSKAREERLLAQYHNVTILRPYILHMARNAFN